MRYILSAATMAVLIWSCNGSDQGKGTLQRQIDSLQAQVNRAYKPGFGDFMSGIQVHHVKLWFAGINQNWQLANFEIHEIRETLGYIKTYCADRPETKSLGMIDEPLQLVNEAVQQKSSTQFRASFETLTTTCNSCHQETQHGFNVIAIPSTPPSSNQNFKVQKEN